MPNPCARVVQRGTLGGQWVWVTAVNVFGGFLASTTVRLGFSRKAAIALAAVMLVASAWVSAEPGVLVLGRISNDPARHYGQLKPLLNYVVPRMADVGIREGRILMANDVPMMQSYLRRGRVDWVTETTAAGMLLAQRAGAQLLMLSERGGRSHYASVIFARRDSGIGSLAQLRGHRIAFQNRASTSSYIVPASLLLDAGLTLELLSSTRDQPAADTVGYLFARSDSNVLAWVEKGLVSAGAVSDIDWARVHSSAAAQPSDLFEVMRSAPFPRGVEMVRAGMAAPVRDRLRAVLLAASHDPEGRAALAAYFGTTGFHLADEHELAALAQMRARVVRVKALLE
ncbi:MAG: metal-binding protein [Lysobacterales bacterium CG17_big_fil_post_rev_8_21_14_2_50_64_11]|nr:MAG: metal-binding protein [Xanthomonadales bacterium CG17_big_fil_post_rev_8_21_14_2_50_64_11]